MLMMSYGVVLRSLPNARAGILMLLDDVESAAEVADELNAKGIEVDVKRMVKRDDTPIQREAVPLP